MIEKVESYPTRGLTTASPLRTILTLSQDAPVGDVLVPDVSVAAGMLVLGMKAIDRRALGLEALEA
jgi:hypothetical protein